LPGLEIVGAVFELALDVVETRDRRAAEVLEPRHPVECRLERNADQALHLFGTGPRILGNDFNERRCRVGIGLDVEKLRGDNANHNQPDCAKQHQEAVVQAPCDDRTNHERSTLDPMMGILLQLPGGHFNECKPTLDDGRHSPHVECHQQTREGARSAAEPAE
jgi:hypothetical protein